MRVTVADSSETDNSYDRMSVDEIVNGKVRPAIRVCSCFVESLCLSASLSDCLSDALPSHICNQDRWVGLVGLVRSFVAAETDFDDKTRHAIDLYVDFVSQRASGTFVCRCMRVVCMAVSGKSSPVTRL